MKRILLLASLALAAVLLLTGCASNADPAPTADPNGTGMGAATAQNILHPGFAAAQQRFVGLQCL